MSEDIIIKETLRDAEFKEESPLKTVEHIKEILSANNIETEELWFENGVPYCHSLRVNICGTTFGVNGKGMSRDFTLASGYGELMERLQTRTLKSLPQKKDDKSTSNNIAKFINYKELLKRNIKWYKNYSDILEATLGVKYSPDEIIKQFADKNGDVKVAPFFCVNTRTIEYHPIELRTLIYTSNGSAAGNTPEEAIVQGISEIVERRHKIRILTENIVVPEIPDEVLKKYTAAYKIITFLRDNGFDVTVKDCSLGTKYPVICLSCIDKATGKYHDHFGAFPIFEIALERALTETFQGRSIDSFATTEDFIYDKISTYPFQELISDHAFGTSKKKPEFFIGKSDESWNENCGFSGKNNKELFKECMDFFIEQGYDVLIRDCSFLGFPTYQILIPGYSETYIHRLSPNYNDLRDTKTVADVFRNPAAANIDDILATISYLSQNSKTLRYWNYLTFKRMSRLSAKLTAQENSKLFYATLGFIFYSIGKYNETMSYVQQLLPFCEKYEKEYLICLKRYLSMKLHNYEDLEIKTILEFFHKPETIEEFYACITNKCNPLERFTLHCGLECNENCPLKHCCCEKYTNQTSDYIESKFNEMNIDTSVKTLLKSL